MAVNKVLYGETTVMDITDTTAEAADVASGKVFYMNNGVRSTGTGDYMDKVSDPTANNILITDASGQAQDSGVSINDNATKNYVDTQIAAELENFEHQDYEIVDTLPAVGDSGVRYLLKVIDDPGPPEEWHMEEYMYIEGAWRDCGRFDSIKEATDTVAGTIKLNPNESIDLDSNGRLTVGGRLGQFPNGGLYYPTSADPVAVGNYTLLMSEAKGLSAAHRELIIAGGSTVALKTAAAAGATQYRISNTQNNRFVCLGWVDGRLAVDEAGAKEKTVAITSVKFANGNNISAYFGATESNNDIVITVAETLNSSGTLSSVRGYGTWKNADIVSAGQGNYVGGGKVLQVGQANVSANNKNQIGMIGIRQYCDGASSLLVGADNVNKKAFCALFGQGIDNSSGPEGLAAFGKWPEISSDTAFVIGNGTAYNARNNLFEIKTNGDVYVNGVKKITG